MTSKIRQPIFSFDMDMDFDVDETPKKMKSGKIIDRKTKQHEKQQKMWKLYCVLYCDDMLLQLARCDTADNFKCAFENAPLFSNSHS